MGLAATGVSGVNIHIAPILVTAMEVKKYAVGHVKYK